MLVVGDGVQLSAWTWAASVGVGSRPLDWDCGRRELTEIGDNVVGKAPPFCDTEAGVGGGEMIEGVGRMRLTGIAPRDADGRRCTIGSKSS